MLNFSTLQLVAVWKLLDFPAIWDTLNTELTGLSSQYEDSIRAPDLSFDMPPFKRIQMQSDTPDPPGIF
jgi:hypothetical protein